MLGKHIVEFKSILLRKTPKIKTSPVNSINSIINSTIIVLECFISKRASSNRHSMYVIHYRRKDCSKRMHRIHVKCLIRQHCSQCMSVGSVDSVE
jgi:hypothetical protein